MSLQQEATFAVQTAMYYDGEKIERIRVASVMGGKSKVVYITENQGERDLIRGYLKIVA